MSQPSMAEALRLVALPMAAAIGVPASTRGVAVLIHKTHANANASATSAGSPKTSTGRCHGASEGRMRNIPPTDGEELGRSLEQL
jgi:hypothetical protein